MLYSANTLHNIILLADDAHAARRRYKKDLDLIKADLESYNKQKDEALGSATTAVDAFYRDANTLLYADNKPSEEAIDRVVSKINRE